jgi:phosphoglycolate phosphatase-like HAD superfamily hydrolase
MDRLILFDIDGTLMDTGGAGARSLNIAFRDVFSIENAFSGITMAGKTDVQIIKEAFAVHKIPGDNGALPSLLSRYVMSLKGEIEKSRKHLKPGVLDILKRFRETACFHLGLLTGNIEEGARIKLESFGLNDYFEAGAFGSDDEDRNRLLPVAVRKFSLLKNVTIAYSNCIVIGDTPRDVSCSRPYGAVALAVSTGPYSYDSLLRTGANLVVHDLSKTEEILSFCLGCGTS